MIPFAAVSPFQPARGGTVYCPMLIESSCSKRSASVSLILATCTTIYPRTSDCLELIDIAFAPIDGIWQISHDELFRVLGVIKARIVIPMHFGYTGELEVFIARTRDHWEIRRHNNDSIH